MATINERRKVKEVYRLRQRFLEFLKNGDEDMSRKNCHEKIRGGELTEDQRLAIDALNHFGWQQIMGHAT